MIGEILEWLRDLALNEIAESAESPTPGGIAERGHERDAEPTFVFIAGYSIRIVRPR